MTVGIAICLAIVVHAVEFVEACLIRSIMFVINIVLFCRSILIAVPVVLGLVVIFIVSVLRIIVLAIQVFSKWLC